MNRQTITFNSRTSLGGVIDIEVPRPDGKEGNYEALQIVHEPGSFLVYQAYAQDRMRVCRMLTGPACTFVLFGDFITKGRYRAEDVEVVYDSKECLPGEKVTPYPWG